jgi:uncharacterized protein YndB with AHSA1/START domain
MTKKQENRTALTITRVFDSPRELLWKAWTDPGLCMRWWGPKNFTAPVIRMDLRVGGSSINCMRSPEGQEYWSTGVYREIVPMERIVTTDSFADEKGNVVPASHYGMPGDWPLELLITVTFEDAGGKTRMVLRHEGLPAGIMSEQTEAGWNESFDKLAEILKIGNGLVITAEPGKQELILTRTVDAPRTAVFKAQTDPALIPQWWGPRRFSTVVDKMDPRPGGMWRFVQRDAEGNVYAFKGVYHEVVSPERIVYTFEFEGTPGHVSLESVTFEELGNRTKMTDKVIYQSVEDRDDMLRSGMEEGARETMDRFAELVEKIGTEKKAA